MGTRADFFVSHAGSDRAWAEWVAWQLTDAGYTVELDVWDWPSGQNFVLAMSDALTRCDRVVALFSAAYFERPRYTTDEWTAALVHGPGREQGRLVPVRVEDVPTEEIPAVLRPLMFCDLFGLNAPEARQKLLEAVAGPRRPDGEPVFPGSGTTGALRKLGDVGPRLPGSLPRVWNIPARNPGFIGRDGLLATVRERLLGGERTVVQALEGMGGVGKTQLAIEYAHRFAGDYELAWWINAEEAGLIGAQHAELAVELGCAQPDDGLEVARRVVLRELRQRDRWLLVFDNAEDPEVLRPWLPGGAGHVLITSRASRSAGVAMPVPIDVLARTESVAILQDQVPGLLETDADQVARALGDLPLALAQAAGYMADTGIPAAEYVGLLAARATEILSEGRPLIYPRPLAAVTQLALDKLAVRKEMSAARLAEICAFLAPEPIPADWFTIAAGQLPAPLGAQAEDPVAWRQVLAQLSRSALARIDRNQVQMHRLTQAIIRGHLAQTPAMRAKELAGAVLTANDPGDPDVPGNWPGWARLLPHLFSLDPAATSSSGLRNLACHAATYLVRRSDVAAGNDLARDLYRQWRDRLGPDDHHTRWIQGVLAYALREMDRYEEARDLDQDNLARSRNKLGEDDPATLNAATNLANDLDRLGDYQAAQELHEDTFARKRRILGTDHPITLSSANNLAIVLGAQGKTQEARDLFEDTLTRRRRVLGTDHPTTLDSANNLAAAEYGLGDYQAARDLDQDILDRRRRVQGEDHPATLASASNLALDLRALDEADDSS